MHETSETKKQLDEAPTIEPGVLEKVLSEIAEDAAKDPARYIQETIVPEGGE
jgi:hypothetical protein